MRKTIKNKPQLVSIGGILTTITVIFQSAPIFLPGIGLFLSPFATLPIFLASAFSPLIGITTYICSALIIFLISPQEAIIFFFSTGILGLIIGLYESNKLKAITYATIGLSIGISLLTYVIQIIGFIELTVNFPFIVLIFSYSLFSLVYAIIWFFLSRFFMSILKKLDITF